jgi:peptide-methionine (S)-S-oxide reductase
VATRPTRNHGTHAEAIEILFDPTATSYRKILGFFFQIHDPTTKNRQGNDVGTSYRSAIFYLDDEQKQVAEDTIADVEASGLWPGKVVTEVTAAGPFWEAEPEHQNYLQRYPAGYTATMCVPNGACPRGPNPARRHSPAARPCVESLIFQATHAVGPGPFRSSSASHPEASASDAVRHSPRGDSEPLPDIDQRGKTPRLVPLTLTNRRTGDGWIQGGAG